MVFEFSRALRGCMVLRGKSGLRPARDSDAPRIRVKSHKSAPNHEELIISRERDSRLCVIHLRRAVDEGVAAGGGEDLSCGVAYLVGCDAAVVIDESVDVGALQFAGGELRGELGVGHQSESKVGFKAVDGALQFACGEGIGVVEQP